MLGARWGKRGCCNWKVGGKGNSSQVDAATNDPTLCVTAVSVAAHTSSVTSTAVAAAAAAGKRPAAALSPTHWCDSRNRNGCHHSMSGSACWGCVRVLHIIQEWMCGCSPCLNGTEGRVRFGECVHGWSACAPHQLGVDVWLQPEAQRKGGKGE